MNILVTGNAGFIGFHLCKRLMSKKNKVYAIDNCNKYYDNGLKKARLKILNNYSKKKKFFYNFTRLDISNRKKLENFFKKKKIHLIIHLAAQAGVRFSLEVPDVYLKSNIQGYLNLILIAKKKSIKNIIYASSSSVYGNNNQKPFREDSFCNKPLQLYAVTKITNEYMSEVYSKLYNIKFVGLRFFTVYGPFGRPDMALFKFTKKILSNEVINFFSLGKIKRDFTYIDDVIESIVRITSKIKKIKSKHEVLNIGFGKPQSLDLFLKIIQKELRKTAKIKKFKEKKEDAIVTFAETVKLNKLIGKFKKTNIQEGVKKFVSWYLNFYKIK